MTRTIDIEALCADKGLRITEQRKVIARVLGESEDHPDVETLHARAAAVDPNISIATVYRTVRLFEEAGILERHEFGDGRSRYEAASETHHDHLIDVETGAARGFTGSSAAFFAMVLSHTHQGMFGDPYYGGNKDFVGWDLIGYPGVRTMVTASDQKALESHQLKPNQKSAYDYESFTKPAKAEK